MTSAGFFILPLKEILSFYCTGAVKRPTKRQQESLIRQSDINKIMKEGAMLSKAGVKFEEAKKN